MINPILEVGALIRGQKQARGPLFFNRNPYKNGLIKRFVSRNTLNLKKRFLSKKISMTILLGGRRWLQRGVYRTFCRKFTD